MLVWILSTRLVLVYDHRPAQRSDADFVTGIVGGSLFMTYHPSHQFGSDSRWSCGVRYSGDTRFYWWFTLWQPDDLGGGYYYTKIPLWSIGTPMLIGGGASVITRRREAARRLAGQCSACTYDITGITGPCPECGREQEPKA
jgi:hypothetical protein